MENDNVTPVAPIDETNPAIEPTQEEAAANEETTPVEGAETPATEAVVEEANTTETAEEIAETPTEEPMAA